MTASQYQISHFSSSFSPNLFPIQIKLRQLIKSWFFSYMGNFLGATLLAGLCTYAGVFSSATAGMVSLAAYKASLPFGVVSF